MPRRTPSLIGLALILALVSAPRDAAAAAKKALFVTIAGDYDSYGGLAFAELDAYATAVHGASGLVDYVTLATDGQVAALLAANTYEQIWVYDLSTGRPDNYPTDFAAIAAWYNQAPIKEVICDGRFLGSYYSNRHTTEGRKLAQNYYYNLQIRGGGIVLATDHDIFAANGINPLANLLGLGPFTGNFGGSFPLDQGHPLTSEPHVLTSLANDTSTGQAPFGLQPGGRTLRTIGYHSGVATNPGISTTIDGGVLGITVDIAESGDVLCEGTRTFTASIASGSQFGPFTYEWRVNNVVVGTGTSYTFNADARTAGSYEVKVIAQGAGARADDDAVTMTVGGAACGCGFDAESICSQGGGAVIAIALEGPLEHQYVVCRLVPAGLGTPAAESLELRCTDADNDGELDLFDGETLVSQFANGFCGYTSTVGAF